MNVFIEIVKKKNTIIADKAIINLLLFFFAINGTTRGKENKKGITLPYLIMNCSNPVPNNPQWFPPFTNVHKQSATIIPKPLIPIQVNNQIGSLRLLRIFGSFVKLFNFI